ncbi:MULTISPECIES: hypothetical protein [Brucella]|uniref:hypothetical protein n=1 Tax=Brucella TaxID=234 RepID=UPI001F137344|nr:hypothetical protein [Brucella ciceri]MCH6205270.1 hypothetical protein [Brucella ciceri]
MKTKYTRTGERDMTNRKPYRTAAQKAEARASARLIDGRYVSNAPVTYHRAPKRGAA